MISRLKPEADFLFEVSWEVCNKVGGIFTVLSSKAYQTSLNYKNYYLIGPYFPNSDKQRDQFIEENPPQFFQQSFDNLLSEGILCHFGKWQIEGKPNVILIDFSGFLVQANEIKRRLWEDFSVDSLSSGFDFTEPVVFSFAVGKFLENSCQRAYFNGKKIAAQFHEWLSGAGLLYLKKNIRDIKTIFTTHATILGRTLANNNNLDWYSDKVKIDVQKEPYNFNIQAKHQLERVCAKECDVLTTVSEITALEVEKFLGRKPDVILPNGLDLAKFPNFEELVLEHRLQKERIKEFLLYYFFPYYTFSLNDTLLFFTLSRYEFFNKGIDVFIKSLGKLNNVLKTQKSGKTVVVFFWIPSAAKEINPQLIDSKNNFTDIKDSLIEHSQELQIDLLSSLLEKNTISETDFEFDVENENVLKELGPKILKFKKKGLAPLSTHILSDPNDIILKSCQENGLQNQESDRVKVIFYPAYLSGSDGLLNLNCYESIVGSHLGVFPSFYEPWGYTTLETAALGVASITTDFSGFGKAVGAKKIKNKYPGIFVLNIWQKQREKAIEDLYLALVDFVGFSHDTRIKNKISSREKASLFDWKYLILNYIKAHNLALRKK